MGRHIAVAALAILVAGSGWTSTAQAQTWADGLFAEHGFDFGPVPRGGIVRHNFVLTNRFAENVTILDVRASCGCTSGRASTSIVEPGKTAYVEAQMDTRNFVGRKATKLIITMMTASGQNAEAQVAVVSNILPDIVLNPGSIDFGSLAKGQGGKQVMTLERVGAADWKFVKMTATGKILQLVDAKLEETERSAARVGYRLTVALKPNAPAGLLREEIRLFTNDPESPSVPILVTAQIQGTITAAPTLLAMGQATEAGAQGRFLLRGSKPFAIKEIGGQGDGFAVTVDNNQDKPLHVLTVTYRPSAGSIRGDLRRTFQVVTDRADEPPVDLSITLRVEP